LELGGGDAYGSFLVTNKQINKGKTPSEGTREEKRKDLSPNKRPHLKLQNTQCEALRGATTKPRT
jgi:hypothetical protein